ncbi:MAG: hypothetical protein KatS3mg076_0126 [Candidatus Binatia bacterium]|nr:MAG: hypothetical protein KatS3mg076_0126 [Candidatus Binatia bacterium]
MKARCESSRAAGGGFTLIELALVLLIVGIVLSFAAPRLGDRSRMELRSHARRLATTMRLLRNEAVLDGRIYRLHFDLEAGRYWVTAEARPGDTTDPLARSGPLLRPVQLPPTVAFSDVVLATTGKLREGQVYTRFFPDGFVEPTVVHLDNGREAFTLSVWPFTGQVQLEEGYVELELVG